MKKVLLILLGITLISLSSYAQVNMNNTYVQGYFKKDGTYVQGYYKTVIDTTNKNNYSTAPNSNTYTTQQGYKAQDYSPQANNYGNGKQIFTGPQGGQYYINSNGNKTYIPKRPK